MDADLCDGRDELGSPPMNLHPMSVQPRLYPDLTLHRVPDCGHLPPIEKPRIVASVLKDLLATPRASNV